MMTKILLKAADFLTLYVLMIATSVAVFTTVSEGLTFMEAIQAALITCAIKTALCKGYHAVQHKLAHRVRQPRQVETVKKFQRIALPIVA